MKEVKLPELSDDKERAIISYWHMEEGDPVEEGEDLVEIIVDGAAHNIPSPHAGILNEILFEDGDEVEVGEVIATIEEENSDDLDWMDEGEEY